MNADCAISTSRTLPDSEITHALQRLINNKNLRLSERNKRFLAFVVSETLEGRSQRIKAYSIGLDVFGRPDNFNPAVDPIVRIEATRLRTALSCYYDGPGALDDIRITLPAGGYIPHFERRSLISSMQARSQPLEKTSASKIRAPVILKHLTHPENQCAFNYGKLLIDSIAILLSKRRYPLFVTASEAWDESAEKHRQNQRLSGHAFIISVYSLADRLRYTWRITELQSGRIKCADFRDQHDNGLPAADIIDTMAEAAVESFMVHV